MKNPGALAGATGVDFQLSFKTEHYRNRFNAASKLGQAIAECHPQDACTLMEAAMADLTFGEPGPVMFSPMFDARWWASYASPFELKAFALASFEAMHPNVQSAFLAYVQRRAS